MHVAELLLEMRKGFVGTGHTDIVNRSLNHKHNLVVSGNNCSVVINVNIIRE